jgi:hypothetical protein
VIARSSESGTTVPSAYGSGAAPRPQRLDVDARLAQIDQAARLPELEEEFVKVAASWAKRSRISAAALREVGVPARVLARAGL